MPSSHTVAVARRLVATLLAMLLPGFPGAPAVAAERAPSVVNRVGAPEASATGGVQAYWTRQRMENAQPLPIPEPDDDFAGRAAQDETAPGPSHGTIRPSAPPAVILEPDASLDSVWVGDDASDDEETAPATLPPGRAAADVPSSSGTDGCHFTSSRLNPRTIDAKYPYSAVGKLFFTKPGIGDFVCSGAVLRPRLVVTAGHCVHSGAGVPGNFFTNFLFCPAYRGGPSAKFGCWDWSFLTVTTTWATGGGTFPNAADYAMLEIVDRSFGGTVRRIGDVTGYFGYQTLNLTANHVHLLGYPAEFSGGVRMHQVASGRCYSGGNNSERYGSDMRGGSSGGPWVQDFGRTASGQSIAFPNLIVGITSYSNVSTAPKYQGSSIPDGRFDALVNDVCSRDTTAPANCF